MIIKMPIKKFGKVIREKIYITKKILYIYNYLIHYRYEFWNYNNLIERNFGERVIFDLIHIDKRKFEKQLYEVINLNYDILLVEDEDFKRELTILDANLYGQEKRNYSFIIPLMVVIFSLAGTNYSLLINISPQISSKIVLISFICLFFIISLYISASRMQHRHYCNIIAYYKLCLGIVNNLYDKHKQYEHEKK